jgi:hypothetical protein
MLNIFGSSLIGDAANRVVNARLQASPFSSLYDFSQPQKQATTPNTAASQPQTEQEKMLGSYAEASGTTPPSPTTSDMTPPAPMITGSKGIKGILGTVFPLLGAAFSLHDSHQQQANQIVQQNQ